MAMPQTPSSDQSPPPDNNAARETYDAFAPSYDDFNHRYMFERWTTRLLGRAQAAGVNGTSLFDVGCGTGLSFIALLDSGWSVTACDISPAMLVKADQRAGGRASLMVADMRDLPRVGTFDLVWAINDAVNYLLTTDDLRSCLAAMRGNLAPNGVVLFDVNTLAAYRAFFTSKQVVEHNGRRMVWSGQMSPADIVPGVLCESRFSGEGEGVCSHRHFQRHHPEGAILEAVASSGLRCVEVLGEREGNLDTHLDEDLHTKAVYVCTSG